MLISIFIPLIISKKMTFVKNIKNGVRKLSEGIGLTLHEVAELEGKSYASIRQNALRGYIKAYKHETGTRKGFEYRVHIEDLSAAAKIRYYANRTEPLRPEEVEKEERSIVSLEQLSKQQRESAYLWESILKSWQDYVMQRGSVVSSTREFIDKVNKDNDMNISERTLYRKLKLYRNEGIAALADMRKSRKKEGAKIDDEIWSIFESWWLDESRRSVGYCYKIINAYAKMHAPEALPLPSISTFRRKTNEIPEAVKIYFREGKRAYENKVLPYIQRMYDFMSNDFWSSDYHTLDIMVRDDVTGKVFRPHVVTWIDVRSRKVLALRLCESSSSDGVVLAFRDAVMRFGIPKNVYLDNGREFLVHDFGGRNKRKTSVTADYGTNILDRLGVNMINAQVKNSKAKVIERSYRAVSEQFSKLYITFCGNAPGNRPERHNEVLKDEDNIPLLSKVKNDLLSYIEGFYNEEPSNAEGLFGKSPNECYEKNLISKRTASKEQLNIHLLRASDKQTYQRNGVYLTFSDVKIQFYNPDLVNDLFKKKVYVHYDPENLDEVRLYNEDEIFVGVAYRKDKGGYDMQRDLEAVKKNNAVHKKLKKNMKILEKSMKDNPAMLEVAIENARRKQLEVVDPKATVIEPMRLVYKEEKLVSGQDVAVVDLKKMIDTIKARKEDV